MKQKDASLKKIKQYRQHKITEDGVWWDKDKQDPHRYKAFNDKQQTIDYYWHIGENFKDGTIDTDNLPRKQRLALYGMSQQSKYGDNNDPTPAKVNIKGNLKHKAWNKMKGKTQEQARKQFITYAESIIASKLAEDPVIKEKGKRQAEKMAKDFDN